jgi:hypothetical protein
MEFNKSYWICYILYTSAFVLAFCLPGDVGTDAAHRGSEILIGIGLLGLAIVHTFGGWLPHWEKPTAQLKAAGFLRFRSSLDSARDT